VDTKNVENRRFDYELNESVLSKSFSATEIPQNVKYLMESMLKIDDKYNERTKEAAKRVKNHLESGFNLSFNRAYRTQGSVMTSTNIKVHSDFDLLTIIDRYHYLSPDLPNDDPYKDSNPHDDIKNLRKQAEQIMESKYDEVNKEGDKSIYIFNKALNRKVDIVFCFWFNTKEYVEKNDEYYRGVYLFNFKKDIKIKDFPFAHIDQVNWKGNSSNDGSRKAIRLLKTLKADAEDEIDLNSFQLTTIVHSIPTENLYYNTGNELKLAIETSTEMTKLINNSSYRISVQSPNGTENPFKEEKTVLELKRLKKDLDSLIEDVQKEMYYGYISNRQLIYS
jgi:hypothetical protein